MKTEKIRKAFEYILNEAHLHPDDSLVDIANEAFEEMVFDAEWNDDDSWPITVKPHNTPCTGHLIERSA